MTNIIISAPIICSVVYMLRQCCGNVVAPEEGLWEEHSQITILVTENTPNHHNHTACNKYFFAGYDRHNKPNISGQHTLVNIICRSNTSPVLPFGNTHAQCAAWYKKPNRPANTRTFSVLQ